MKNQTLNKQPRALSEEEKDRHKAMTELQQRILFADDNINFWHAMRDHWQNELQVIIDKANRDETES